MIRSFAVPAALIALTALLAACASGPPPPRQPTTEAEHLYLRCIGQDPLFLTTRCREARARVTDDPTPGLFGR